MIVTVAKAMIAKIILADMIASIMRDMAARLCR